MPQSDLDKYVGQVLDDKYRLERLLGQGGMGAVYLATHLGTERYVALKLIAPQFMRNPEFVERFKREARAAGRLRHPNVVDVTDFGFAHAGVGAERMAYLVMEYLDGCTLTDVLSEEKRLPLYWVADIIEQVCSAVHEAHQQGIVHRDLKPDNIWLEPNRLGGYRIKVLDFGIAKLGEAEPLDANGLNQLAVAPPPLAPRSAAATVAYGSSDTQYSADLEKATLIQPSGEGDAIANPEQTSLADDSEPTQLYELATLRLASLEGGHDTDRHTTGSTSELTRVGAILGTPLYMSPEQCRGESLDARSDIYSLGIITYQMLAGAPPFAGDSSTVLRAHNETSPTPLREHDPKLRKRVAAVIMSALEKDPANRPQTAVAFANSLRANADGLGALYRRAFALYSEYFPTFLKLSLLAHIPVIIVTALMLALRLLEKRMHKALFIGLIIPGALLQVVSQFLCASVICAVTAILITQLAVAPMKPVELRSAFRIVRRRWRPFLNTGIRIGLRILLGWILFVIPGIVMTVRYTLWAPVVLMEGLEKKAARQRARALAARSWRTIIMVTLINFLVPAIIGAIIGALTGSSKPSQHTIKMKVATELASLVNIFVLPLAYMIPALLYLKMRQFGGETINDVMAQVEDVEGEHSQWQQRMRTRLTMNTPHSRGRISSSTNSPPPTTPAS
jgi:serine/threonine protein kinase